MKFVPFIQLEDNSDPLLSLTMIKVQVPFWLYERHDRILLPDLAAVDKHQVALLLQILVRDVEPKERIWPEAVEIRLEGSVT